MTRYFFHLYRADTFIQDFEGEEFASLDRAKKEAVEAARELVATAVRMGQPINGDRIEICDAADQRHDVVRLADLLPPRRISTFDGNI
ncbi:hypothetical protein [Aureimonas sp. AU4]|uniref:DUF6894 family protein n=1 Tax=Aureimonas sp. AU4 TaxID=1638163 RepID=UPI00078359B5|nr:hypothetical protein [Aureimonas sp. AU4]